MSERDSAWLTPGEYFSPAPERSDRQRAATRWKFIQAVARLVPSFFTSLRELSNPEFGRFIETHPEITWWQLQHTEGVESLITRLLNWGAQFHLDGEGDEWVFDGALRCLSSWHRVPEMLESMDYHGFLVYVAEPVFPGAAHPFVFEEAGWDFLGVSFSGWRERARSHFEQAILAYESEARNLASDTGFIKTIERYSEAHLEWLALYQYGNLSLDDICSRYPMASDRTTISKGMHNAAQLIGVTVRKKRS